MTRLVAVLGYSRRSGPGLDPVCAARLHRAEELVERGDTVLLSGRGHGTPGSEAALMAAAWARPEVQLVLDHDARTTVGNARSIARHAEELDADELLIVTSSWHRPRAALLVRAALRRSRIPLRTATAPRTLPLLPVLRELACVIVLPLQLVAAGRGAA